MADPRTMGPMQRRANFSPLMTALNRRQQGEIINFCPFGCEESDLDENGYCGHLVGFYNGGDTFEPRVRRKADGRIITDGTNRRPMQKGFVRVKITTSARVYSPQLVRDLVPKAAGIPNEVRDSIEREKKLQAFAEQIRNPVLDGEWEGSIYDPSPLAAAATPPPPK